MFKEPVVFIDIETSGTSYHSSRIIEIAAIRVENDEIVDQFQSLIRPGRRIPHWITQITGISEQDLIEAPTFKQIAPKLVKFLEGAIFIAHNVRFDYSFIKNELNDLGYEYNPKLLCTVRLSRSLFPENRGHSLEKIIHRHNINVSKRHRAFDDAKAIYDFTVLAFETKGDAVFKAAIDRQLKTRTLPPNLDEKYLTGVKNTPGVYVFEDDTGTPVYIGKSVRLRSRILSHFSQDGKFSKEMNISLKTHKLKTIETQTELEALLLESQMIKEYLPIYNQKLRRKYNQTVFLKHTDDNGYLTIKLANKNLSEVNDLSKIFGVYETKMKANTALESILNTYQLCPKLLGLEKSSKSCFRYHLHKCKGACIGKENPDSYNQRVEWALEASKLAKWPYNSPIIIPFSDTKSAVVDQWIIIGYLDSTGDYEPIFSSTNHVFELDTYKILKSYIKNSKILNFNHFKRNISLPKFYF